MVKQASEAVREILEQARVEEDARSITEDDIARARARIGVEIPRLRPDWRVCTADAVYHYCQGLGDDNPLYCDETYARQTRWGGVIAPPFFVRNMGVSRAKDIPQDVRERGAHALAGVHTWYSGDNFEFFQPIREGDELTVRQYLKDVIVKRSEFTGTAVHRITRTEWVNQHGHMVATNESANIAGGREKEKGERKKYADLEEAIYTPDQVKDIAAQYAQEVKNRRGATSRYWEDVQIGEDIPTVIKGPITVSDMIAWNYGDGLSMIQGAHRIAWQGYIRHPRGYTLNEQGIPDIIERVHWEDEMSQRTGNPWWYDYGAQRGAWMAHLATDWVGDDGWVRQLSCQFRRFNYKGDLTYFKGKVVSKEIRDGEHRVELDIWGEDQRGRVTTPGKAVALLPSRQDGPVKLPVIVPDWW